MKVRIGVAAFFAVPIAALGAMCAYSIAIGDGGGAAVCGFAVVFAITWILLVSGPHGR